MNKSKSILVLLVCSALILCITAYTEAKDTNPQTNSRKGLPDRFEGAKTVVYKKIGDVELHLHIFNPKGHTAEKPRPAIVFFFGGGWNGGTPKQFEPHARYLAERGMVAATAEYRVRSRNGTTPYECVKDGKSAVRYLRENAKMLGILPDKIAAAGGSAGGHVAATTGTIEKFNNESDNLKVSAVPNAMVLFNPVIDTGPKGFGRKDRTDISPSHHVTGDVPPTIIFHGKKDTTVPPAQVEAFAKKMKKAGRKCELHMYPGMPHGFFNKGRNKDVPYLDTVKKMDAFLVGLDFLKAEKTE